MEPVAIRRKADGKYLAGGNSLIPLFAAKPRLIKTESKAITLIRCDLGEDLADYEIIPRSLLPA